ncbi:MAG: DUF3096 domain-containing protein [Candidatus Omnitrophica bacterium]|nr:DUF3096 domain-containing protein [Candidatus Omnitrophota bacterium]
MVTGIVFIIAGILIAIFPELLSLIVSVFLVTLGVGIVLTSYHHKRLSQHFDNPFADFIFRF